MDFEKADEAMRNFLTAHRFTSQQHFRSCGLFNGHPPMLFRLYENPGRTVKELATDMQVSPASVCTSLKRMESVGLVTREADPDDHRLVRFSLTESGTDMHRRCHEGRKSLMIRQYNGMTEKEIDELTRLLQKMTENMLAFSMETPSCQPETEEVL